MNAITGPFLILALLLSGPAAATKIWQWTDSDGRTHYSDTAPGTRDKHISVRRLSTLPAERPSGLRSGELRRLQQHEQRMKQRKQRVQQDRNRHDREQQQQQARCSKSRSQQRTTRDRELRKQHTVYLNKHCW